MDGSIQDVTQIVSQLNHRYIDQFLVALLPMGVTVILHGYGMGLVAICLKRFGRRPGQRTPDKGPHVLLLIAIVGVMLFTHFVEVFAWAVFYFATNMLHDFVNAMYFSINSYTTLGASNITLDGRWKGLDGFEAMTAMLMFGWSTAVLAAVVQRTHSVDA